MAPHRFRQFENCSRQAMVARLAVGGLTLRHGSLAYVFALSTRMLFAQQPPATWQSPTLMRGLPTDRNIHAPSITTVLDTSYLAANALPFGSRAPVDSVPIVIARTPGGRLRPPPGEFQFIHPKIIGDARGRVHLFWAEFPVRARDASRWEGLPSAIWHAELDPRGWSRPETVVKAKTLLWGEHGGMLAADSSGGIQLTLPVSADGGADRLVFLRWSETGWRRKDLSRFAAYASVAALPNHRSIVAFVGIDSARNEDHNTLFVTTSRDDGNTWSTAVAVSRSGTLDVAEPRLLSTGSSVQLLWANRKRQGLAIHSLEHSASTDGGNHWSGEGFYPLPRSGVSFDAAAAVCGEIVALVQILEPSVLQVDEVSWRDNHWFSGAAASGFDIARDAAVRNNAGEFSLVMSGYRHSNPEFGTWTRTRPACAPQ